MTGDDVRTVFEQWLPQEEMDRWCQQWGVIERQRQLHLGMWVGAMVIAAGTPGGASQADILRSYLACEVPRVCVGRDEGTATFLGRSAAYQDALSRPCRWRSTLTTCVVPSRACPGRRP